MPDTIIQELWGLIPTVLYFFTGLVLFGIGVFAMEKVTPFSIKKEVTEDHNTALGVIIGSALIGLAIILAAAIK